MSFLMGFFWEQAMYYFPLTNRIQAIYRTPTLAKHMTHHYEFRSKDGTMRIPSDSWAWRSIIRKYQGLDTKYGNVFLGLATDGVILMAKMLVAILYGPYC
jgi:hypothetical protein